MRRQIAIYEIRSQILALFACIGDLCYVCLSHFPLDQPYNETSPDDASFDSVPKNIQLAMAKVLSGLVETAKYLTIDLKQAVLQKVNLNQRKYPVSACKVRTICRTSRMQ